MSVLVLSGAAGGACRGTAAESPSRDGSAAEAASDLPSATDYADVTIEQDFTQPFSLPPPTTTIQGDATSLVGVWDEVSALDGGTCDHLHEGPGGEGCFHIEIQQDTSGALHGRIRADGSYMSTTRPQGPFAPATDPNVGYPTTLNPREYYHAKLFCSNVDYRLLDPIFASSTFSFWFSPFDLWTDWCALQTPFAWNVRGQTKYACMPQTADSSTTDFGKLILCSNANDEPLCTDSTGFQGPCVCLDDAGMIAAQTSFYQPLCSNSVCECTASQCRALLRSKAWSATLTLNADELTGPFAMPSDGSVATLTFRRAHP
jgi:hypothetical protein